MLVLAGSHALADGEAPKSDSVESQDSNYKAVGDQPQIQSGEKLVVEAYAIIWIVIFGFIILAWMRTRSLAARLDVLERSLAKASATARGASTSEAAKKTDAPAKEAAESEA